MTQQLAYSHLPGTLGKAVQERVRIGDENMEALYSFLRRNPGLCIYSISKKLGWSPGKVAYTLSKIEELRMVRYVQKIENNRLKLLVYANTWREALPPETIAELREILARQKKKGSK